MTSSLHYDHQGDNCCGRLYQQNVTKVVWLLLLTSKAHERYGCMQDR
jgi:hypothetical protein